MMKFLVEYNLNATNQKLLSLLYAAEELHIENQVDYWTLTKEDVIFMIMLRSNMFDSRRDLVPMYFLNEHSFEIHFVNPLVIAY